MWSLPGAFVYILILWYLNEYIGIDPVWGTVIAQLCNSTFNFFIQKKLIHGDIKVNNVEKIMVRHYIGSACQFGIATALLYVLIHIFDIHYAIAIALLIWPRTKLGKYITERFVHRKNL